MAGIRDSKIVDGVTYNYLTLDGKVVRQTWGSNVLDIIYDNSGLPYAFKYNGAYYIYVLNQQGDVIRIVNSTGATVAEYKYDAWGNLLVAESSLTAIGKINPIRYRGYYYDTETGFYYLQSRYYDPGTGRFINADSFASTGQDFIGYNMFAYCLNNPVTGFDPTGTFDWGSLANGGGWLATGITALAVGVSVLTCGVAAPAMMAVAAVTVVAGAATTVNGVSEIGEAFTGYNVIRDGVLQGNSKAYNAYATSIATVAQVGTAICAGWTAKNSPRISTYKTMNSYNAKPKHLSTGRGSWSKFNTTSQDEIRALGREIIKNTPMRSLTLNSADSFAAIYDFGRVIGTSGETTAKLVFSTVGKIITFYPV